MYFIARLRWLADADESACKFKAFFRCFGSSVYLVASCSLALLYTHSHAHAKSATVVIATAIDFSTFLHSLLRARTGNRLVQLFNKRTQHYHLHVELFSDKIVPFRRTHSRARGTGKGLLPLSCSPTCSPPRATCSHAYSGRHFEFIICFSNPWGYFPRTRPTCDPGVRKRAARCE